jgi:hypothetical protein
MASALAPLTLNEQGVAALARRRRAPGVLKPRNPPTETEADHLVPRREPGDSRSGRRGSTSPSRRSSPPPPGALRIAAEASVCSAPTRPCHRPPPTPPEPPAPRRADPARRCPPHLLEPAPEVSRTARRIDTDLPVALYATGSVYAPRFSDRRPVRLRVRLEVSGLVASPSLSEHERGSRSR